MVTDSLRYWVHRDARRRVPLRPRHHPGARAQRLRQPERLPQGVLARIRCSTRVKLIAEPWDCGPGGYQVGGFPPGWAEWNDKFRDTVRDFWRGEAPARRARAAPVRLGRHLQPSRPQALGERQLRHRARRLHAERSRHLQREAQRGERRGQQRRHLRQPLLELRRRRADRRSGDQRAARAADAQHAGDAAAARRARRCCWPATSSAARSRATTTPIARTTRSAG